MNLNMKYDINRPTELHNLALHITTSVPSICPLSSEGNLQWWPPITLRSSSHSLHIKSSRRDRMVFAKDRNPPNAITALILSGCIQLCLAVDRQLGHSPHWPPRWTRYTSIISISPCQAVDWQPKQSHSAAQHLLRSLMCNTQQSSKCLQVYTTAPKTQLERNS